MIRFAVIGVALGNSKFDVRAAADYVTDDVDHVGFMNALRHFVVIR